MKSTKTLRPVNHVALLTPYNGGNLGDAAIQEALIQCVRRIDAESKITGITLNPALTATLHRIPCFPLAVNSRPHYDAKTTPVSTGRNPGPNNSAPTASSKDSVFNHWITGARSSFLFKPLRGLYRLIKEVRHVLQSYFFLRHVQLLVIAGGGQLDEEWGGVWGHPYALMKWAILARAAGASFVVLSVGACRIDSPISKQFVGVALSLASYRSYRDQGSRQIALQISKHADGPVVPDLAFGLSFAHSNAAIEARESPLVGVSPIAFAHPRLWPIERIFVYERYITELSSFVTSLLHRGMSVVLFSSSTPDEQTFQDIHDRVSSQIPEEDLGRLSFFEAATVNELTEMLGSVDFVVASRLHGLLLSFLAGKPSVAISYDRKVQSLMEDMDQAVYCLDIHSFTHDELMKAFLGLQSNADIISSKLSTIRHAYDGLLAEQYSQLARYFSHASSRVQQAQLPSPNAPVCGDRSNGASLR
jgi:polysaccharide pyruvyl transferase WcaK-like protein